MAKLILTDISSGYLTQSAYNANNVMIEAAIENTLSRDGTSPNTMSADLGMNSQNINNVNNISTQALSIAGTSVVGGALLSVPSAINVPFTQQGTGATVRDVDAKLQEAVSVKDFGAVGDGVADDTTKIQAALDAVVATNNVGSVFFPAGDYLVSSKLTVNLTGSNDKERIKIYGEGAKSIITSTVVGDTTLEINDAAFVVVEGLHFTGNNVTGGSGNGHAIAFRDTLPQSGTFYPQHCDVRDCFITKFRGNDTEVTDTTTGVATIAAGVYIGPGLANYVSRCTITNCGTGIHFDETQNSHVFQCVVSICDDWGLELDTVKDGCSVSACDIVQCGVDGNLDAKVFSGSRNYAGIFSRSNHVVSIKDNKFKVGQAITIFASESTVIRDNYFRCDAPDTVVHTWAIQADTVGTILIDANHFTYLAGTGQAISSAIDIDSQASVPCTATVSNNRFNHAEFGTGGFDVRYKGSSAANSNFIIMHTGNSHGSSRNGRTNSIVGDCIVLDTLNAHGQISGNDFTVTGDEASSGGLITDCLDISSIAAAGSSSRLAVFGNKARIYLTGGTITNDIELYQDNSTGTFDASDATPAIDYKSVWHTDSGSFTITDFDGWPVNGRTITVISEGTVTFDVTGTSLHGGTADIVTAAGDVTTWALDTDGFSWRLIGFMDNSVDNSAGA